MKSPRLITLEQFCENMQIEIHFVESLYELGIIEITSLDEGRFLNETKLPDIEKIARLHYDLDLNPEGIETVLLLMDRMKKMQERVQQLENRLQFFEQNQKN